MKTLTLTLGAAALALSACASKEPALELLPVEDRTGDAKLAALAEDSLRAELVASGAKLVASGDRIQPVLERTESNGLHLELRCAHRVSNVRAWGPSPDELVKAMALKGAHALADEMDWSH